MVEELRVAGKMNLFAIFPIGATMQDGGKRKRSGVTCCDLNDRNPVLCLITQQKKNKNSQKFCKSVLQIKLRGNLVRQLSEII